MTTARAVALRALSWLDKGKVARLREVLDATRLSPREQALAHELAHGALRRERLLDFVLEPFAQRGLPKDPVLRAALRLGAYQLLFLRGMPARAAVFETVELLQHNRAFANALLRRLAEQIEDRAADPARPLVELALGPTRMLPLPRPLPADDAARLAILHSLPDFLVARWCERLGVPAATSVAEAASARAQVFLRATAADAAALQRELTAEGVQCEPTEHPRVLRWVDGSSPFATRAFAAGRFVAQDPTAVRAAEAVPAAPGDIVIDLCAAPGTKTTLLAERVQPGGTVFAWDVDAERRQGIAQNVRRLGLDSTVRIVDDPTRLRPAAAVLADVPCSNTGVLGRRVEVRRRLRRDSFAAMAATQRAILTDALRRVRPGGTVVYSTCSIEAEENEQVVAAVAAAADAPAFTVQRSELVLPLAGRHDGGFHAVLRRSAE